jgi:hypothetical protein
MPTRLKSTLAGLAAWGLFMAAALLLGTPVEHPAAPTAQTPDASRAILADDAATQPEFSSHRRNARLQLAMPYFSFGGLLPRQES